jgi:hypothetical protein
MFSKCFVPLTIVALAAVALGKFESKFVKTSVFVKLDFKLLQL